MKCHEAIRFLANVAKVSDLNVASGVTEANLDKLQLPDSLPAAALVRRVVRACRQGKAGPGNCKNRSGVSAKLLASAL